MSTIVLFFIRQGTYRKGRYAGEHFALRTGEEGGEERGGGGGGLKASAETIKRTSKQNLNNAAETRTLRLAVCLASLSSVPSFILLFLQYKLLLKKRDKNLVVANT